MTTITIRPAERGDCDVLAPRLRKADVVETEASMGLTPVGVLVASLYASDLCWTIIINGRVEGMFGVGSDEDDDAIGVPWLLGSDALEHQPRAMLQVGRRYMGLMSTLYARLQNAVHEDHTASFKWLERIGFRHAGVLRDFGIHQETFYLYVYDV